MDAISFNGALPCTSRGLLLAVRPGTGPESAKRRCKKDNQTRDRTLSAYIDGGAGLPFSVSRNAGNDELER